MSRKHVVATPDVEISNCGSEMLPFEDILLAQRAAISLAALFSEHIYEAERELCLLLLNTQVGEECIQYRTRLGCGSVPLKPAMRIRSRRWFVEADVPPEGCPEQLGNVWMRLCQGYPHRVAEIETTISPRPPLPRDVNAAVAVYGTGEISQVRCFHAVSIPCCKISSKQDSGPRPGEQGRIPADLWARKEAWR